MFIQVSTLGKCDCDECYFKNNCDFGGCRLQGGYHYEEPKVSMKFLCGNDMTHTITDINNERILHTYKDGNQVVTDAFMYLHVFVKLVNQGILYIL